MDTYIDLQYGDHNLEGISQMPQQKGLHVNAVEDPMAVHQFKAIEERLKVIRRLIMILTLEFDFVSL